MKAKPFYYILVPVFIVICIYWFFPWFCRPPAQVFLVRHAEKCSGSNGNLSQFGQDRADALWTTLEEMEIDSIFTSEYCRTAQTAQPTAQGLNKGITVKQISNGNPGINGCNPPITVSTTTLASGASPMSELAQDLKQNFFGKSVLVVNHSNTVPDLVQELTGNSLCPSYFPLDSQGKCKIPDSEYNHLFLVEIPFFGTVKLIKAKYGVASANPPCSEEQ